MRALKKKRLWLALVLTSLTGCVDSANTLSRDYRNINNEAIDALMVVTNERRAAHVTEKILKVYQDRINALDKRTDIYAQNTDNKIIMIQSLNSESLAIMFAENKINLKRMELEQQRLQNLLNHRAKLHVERLRNEGQKGDQAELMQRAMGDARKEWPSVAALAGGGPLSVVKTNLEQGTHYAQLFAKFGEKNWAPDQPPGFQDLAKEFAAKIEKHAMKF